MNDPLNPVIITPEEDKDYTYILMPVRAEWLVVSNSIAYRVLSIALKKQDP